MKQRFKKTPTSQRTTYKYIDANGRCVAILRPDADTNVTEVHIKLLHSLDDAEVYSNIKNCSIFTPSRKGKPCGEWDKEKFAESRWVLSLDWLEDEDAVGIKEQRKLIAQAYRDEIERRRDVRREILYDAVEYLSPQQQKLFRQYYLEEMTQTAIAKSEGVSVVAIHKRLKKLEANIKDIIFKKILVEG